MAVQRPDELKAQFLLKQMLKKAGLKNMTKQDEKDIENIVAFIIDQAEEDRIDAVGV